jgi:late competence protein required for DNA uptake (superfamily II DNA/RNA helicase)
MGVSSRIDVVTSVVYRINRLFSTVVLKANASKSKFKKQKVTATPKEYMEQLEKAIDEDRVQHGKKPLKKNESSLKKEKSE